MPGKKMPLDQRREQILEAAYKVALHKRLSGLSSRAVAAEAGVSNGLLFFYFRSRRKLLLALLDWLLRKTILQRPANRNSTFGNARTRMTVEVQRAVEIIPVYNRRIELFFDYWFMGAQDNEIRKRIRSALKQYRGFYFSLAQEVVEEQKDRYAGVTGEGLADMVTGFIEGCALRLITEPERYDVEAISSGIASWLGPLPPSRPGTDAGEFR